MKTIAIWYEEIGKNKEDDKKTNEDEERVGLDIHINFWKLPLEKGKKSDYFIDFGFMVENTENISKIKIYFPFKLNKENLEDLGKKFNATLTKSIFNENYTIKDSGNKKIDVFLNNEEKFTIYKLDDSGSKDLNFIEEYKGTTISINLEGKKLSGKLYFRFRLNNEIVLKFKTVHIPENSFFEKAFNKIETIDFRINEKRNYDESLLEHINNNSENKEFVLKKVHFLMLRKETEDFISSHINYRIRRLENRLWNDYTNNRYVLRDIVSYHWSEKAKGGSSLDSFNTFVKIKYRVSNYKTIMIYFFILVMFSVVVSLATTGAIYLFKLGYYRFFKDDNSKNIKVSKVKVMSHINGEAKIKIKKNLPKESK